MYFEVKETQSDWVPVRLDDRSNWYPVTQSGTGTGASLEKSRTEVDIEVSWWIADLKTEQLSAFRINSKTE